MKNDPCYLSKRSLPWSLISSWEPLVDYSISKIKNGNINV